MVGIKCARSGNSVLHCCYEEDGAFFSLSSVATQPWAGDPFWDQCSVLFCAETVSSSSVDKKKKAEGSFPQVSRQHSSGILEVHFRLAAFWLLENRPHVREDTLICAVLLATSAVPSSGCPSQSLRSLRASSCCLPFSVALMTSGVEAKAGLL